MSCGQLDPLAAIDNNSYRQQYADRIERIAGHAGHVPVAPHSDRPDGTRSAEGFPGSHGGCLERLQWRHPPGDHRYELPGVGPMRVDAGVGAKQHFDTRLGRRPERLTLLATDHPLLFERFFEHAVLLAFGQDVVIVVDVHVEVGAVHQGEIDRLGVRQARMLDGIGTRPDGGLDAIGTVRVYGNLQTQHVRFVYQRRHLTQVELLCSYG